MTAAAGGNGGTAPLRRDARASFLPAAGAKLPGGVQFPRTKEKTHG